MSNAEVSTFHPMVAQWLIDNNYSYQHEVKLRDGRADFTALHLITGEKLVIECKINSEASSGRFFAQVLDYARQLSGHIPVIAMPSYRLTERAKEVCDYYQIRVIAIDVPESVFESWGAKQRNLDDVFSLRTSERIAFFDEVRTSPKSIVNEIAGYHAQYGTSPFYDLLECLMIIKFTGKGIASDETLQNAELLYLVAIDEIARAGTIEDSKTALAVFDLHLKTKRTYTGARSSGIDVKWRKDLLNHG